MAKQGLTKSGFKDQIGLKLERTRREEKGKREKKRKKKKKMEEIKQAKVWKQNLCMDSMRLCMNFHALLVILLPKSRVFARVSS